MPHLLDRTNFFELVINNFSSLILHFILNVVIASLNFPNLQNNKNIEYLQKYIFEKLIIRINSIFKGVWWN